MILDEAERRPQSIGRKVYSVIKSLKREQGI